MYFARDEQALFPRRKQEAFAITNMFCVCMFYNIYFEGDFVLFQSSGCRDTKVGDLKIICDIIDWFYKPAQNVIVFCASELEMLQLMADY